MVTAPSTLIEALMTRLLDETATVYWNIHQQQWGPWVDGSDPAGDPESYFPIQLGALTITQREIKNDYSDIDPLLELAYNFEGLVVSTWFDSKRLFYRSNLSRDVSSHELTDWFIRLIDHLWALPSFLGQPPQIAVVSR